MADVKKRTFRKYSYRGVDLDQLLEMNNDRLVKLYPCRIRRKIKRGLKPKHASLITKLCKAKMAVAGTSDKPEGIKTHLRDMVITPEMVASIVGVYNGKEYKTLEIKPEMIGMYLGEFSRTYKTKDRGRQGAKKKKHQLRKL